MNLILSTELSFDHGLVHGWYRTVWLLILYTSQTIKLRQLIGSFRIPLFTAWHLFAGWLQGLHYVTITTHDLFSHGEPTFVT